MIDALTSTNELWETVTDNRPVVKTIEAIFEQGARRTSCLTNPWKAPKLNLSADNENIKKKYQDKLCETLGDFLPRDDEDLIEFSSNIVMKVMITSVKVVDTMTAKPMRRSRIRHYHDGWPVEYMMAKVKLIMISKLKSVFSRPEIITRASSVRRSIIIT